MPAPDGACFSSEQIARAYLVYELNGAMHWSEAARSLNGAPSQGGDVRRDASSFTLQAEPIAPAQLQAGLNTVTFSNSPSLPPYQLRHVRLVIEPLDGWNAIAGASSNQGAADSVLDGDAASGWAVYPASQKAAEPALAVTLAQMTAADAVRFQLSQPLTGTLSLDVLTAGGWQTLLDKQPGAQFAAGWNRLPLPGLAISARGCASPAAAAPRSSPSWP